MRRPPRPARIAFFCAAVLLLVAGCENPAGLPDGFDPEGNDPLARTLPADSAALAPLDDFTGAFLTNTGFEDFRTLAGRVDDPAFGTVTARGYLDVLPPSSFPDGFQDRPLEQVTLRLERGYVYGDTLLPVTFDLRQVAEEWAAVGVDNVPAPSDTLFPVEEAVITSFEVAPGDTLVEVALPEGWIAENDTTLRSDDVSTLFHGFQLQAQMGNAAYGFTGGSTLELISAEDTVLYRASELFSNIEAEPPATPLADGLIPLQDGTGRGLALRFDVDTLGLADLNTVFVRVNADTAAVQAPAGFVRPLARELALFGIPASTDDDPDPQPAFITTATLDETSQTFSFASPGLTDILQDLVLDRSRLDRFAVGFPTAPSTLDVVPLLGPTRDDGPRAVIVLVPSDD